MDAERRPTASMLLPDDHSKTNYDQTHVNEIENVRNEVQHNASGGHPCEVVTLEGGPPLGAEHTVWVSSVLRWTNDIKPGMTRKELLKVSATEGRLSTPLGGTSVLKGSPYIKVDVEFKAVGRPERGKDLGPL
jgi:hypothetical protein